MNICSQKKEITDVRVARREIRVVKEHPPTEPPEQDLTGLICWWCVHALPPKPCVHLPIRYDDKRKIFSTIGNFCSWACAKAYALDMGTSRSGEIQMFLATMRMQSMGKFTSLWPAPKRQALKCFGEPWILTSSALLVARWSLPNSFTHSKGCIYPRSVMHTQRRQPPLDRFQHRVELGEWQPSKTPRPRPTH